MEPGDLILTPSWAWHDHGNETKERVVWMDGLDIPLIQSVEAMFFQFYSAQQVAAERPANASKRLYGHTHLSPTWVKEKPKASPLLLYSWDRTWEALNTLRDHEGSAFDGIALEYRHPQTGGPVMPTMACWAQMSAREREKHRHTARRLLRGSRRGDGHDGKRFVGPGNYRVAAWALHEHANVVDQESASRSGHPMPRRWALRREALSRTAASESGFVFCRLIHFVVIQTPSLKFFDRRGRREVMC
jgi:gentisate 1,2-dioxygenase